MNDHPGAIKQAKIALRVSIFDWSNPARVKELIEYIRTHPGSIDEVALFTQISASPLPLSQIREHSRLLKEILPRFKALGITAGINHLATVGHYDENLKNSLNEPWQHLVDISGTVSKGCYCASDPHVQEYVRQAYTALAESRPDFIWFDDDLRLEPHGSLVQYPCFCEGCLAKFSQETGKTWTREGLREAFRSGSLQDRLTLRRQWLEHNRQYAADLLSLMRAGVDVVNPGLTLGFMSVEGSYSAYGMAEWTDALAGKQKRLVMCRPGGGYYEDRAPIDVLAKAHWTGRQVAFLPTKVTDIQYELENFPYQPLRKSRIIVNDELAFAIAVGCTGAALNIMGLTQDPIDEYYPYLDALRACREFYDRAAATFGRGPNLGFWPGFTRDHSAALNPDQDWFATPLWGVDFSQFTELAEIGLPMAYTPEGASLSVLSKTSIFDLPRQDLVKILSKGVMLDGPALLALHELGLGEYTGFSVSGTQELDMFETFTHDPINGRFGGWQRDCHPSFWADAAYLLQPLPGSRVLSEVVDFNQVKFGVGSGVFENSLGGRVAVMGYYPWILLQSLAKSSQLKNLFRWLSRERLPGYVASYTRAGLWCRTDPVGKLAFMMVNASLDPSSNLILNALTGGAPLALLRMDRSEETLAPSGLDGLYHQYTLNKLQPWETVLMVLKDSKSTK